MKELLFGAAYYDEYMPYDRLAQDVEMMKKAGINTVRIAESTWSTCEPQEGVFDFSHVERVMDAMEEAGIHVIIGTPTYAVPSWMVKDHPDVLVTTAKGRALYGSRQIMDITHPAYRFYAERVIRKLMECTVRRKCVIGFQIDNETKHYGTAGENVQKRFIKYLRKKFHDDLDAMNREFGLDYWSNRIDAWEDFPDVRGTVNGSLGAEFEKFQRTLVDDFLAWQADIVREYKREDQFITHNFDFEWRGHSFGVQPEVNHYHAAQALTIAGVDIYHPSQDELTGAEIAFGGDMTRSLKQDNYLMIETQAQGWPGWTPYKGQLRLQAYSHLASGANSVMYWHWHSIHNSMETYWKGLLGHDFQENATYREACMIGREWKEIGSHLVNLRKKNQVAILVSNEALTGLNWFGIEASAAGNHGIRYNDVLRWIYDALYEMVRAVVDGRDQLPDLPDDVTEDRAMVEDVRKRQEQRERAAREAEGRKNELVAYLAHDIKTPLTSVTGYLSLLDETPDMPAEQRKRYISSALDKAYRLDEMMDGFFDITRFNIGSIELERSRFDLATFCDQLADEFQPEAARRAIPTGSSW